MKRNLILLMLTVVSSLSGQDRKDITSVLKSYIEKSNNLTQIEYNIKRMDLFANDTSVINTEGYALIKRSREDNLFGFIFYGDRFDVNEQNIYDGKNEFRIDRNMKTYNLSRPGWGFLGSPGGQMIVMEILFPDTIYKSVKLSADTGDTYLLEYEFEDDTTYSIVNKTKSIEISKINFLPQKVTLSYETLGKKAVHQAIITNVKINSNVTKSIDQIKDNLTGYKLLEEKIEPVLSLINSEAPLFKLPELFNPGDSLELPKGKIILLDFWEVWCGPCKESLPKIEKIFNRFSDSIIVIGITKDDNESSKKFINQKNLTFINLIGNNNIIKTYGVIGYPKYFIIDKKGIVRKEYLGFSSQIEDDIISLLNE